ncbi:DUF2459 domain-containing protein [Polaribacter porphyrae]|uniref:DUF2459 domain-containing protein n=1 Tax=Polaribacter porphyrae TaxID=1137780 RepID=A0A2S7WNS1_9FLAO|nr:DUF2459 domain-containing protein [Polaribacter porphyrae]PQJ79257.1 hypothetical protein BTO18_08760 [Polaribacter porphyrae]
MKIIKKVAKGILYFLLVILAYLLISVLVSYITVNSNSDDSLDEKTIFLSTNGVHLSVIIPKESLTQNVLEDLQFHKNHQYFMFGWGNENFYLNTPTWNDFKLKYGFEALFLNSPTAIHLTTFYQKRKSWIAVKCNQQELNKLNVYILNTFKKDRQGKKIIIPQKLYAINDTFYKANGSYSPVKTCNTWVNSGFKESGLKASYWTLFDFGLLNKYD